MYTTTPPSIFTPPVLCCLLLRVCVFSLVHSKINDDYFECLTPKTMKELIAACKKGEKPEMGRWGSLPLNGQVSCEGECNDSDGIR